MKKLYKNLCNLNLAGTVSIETKVRQQHSGDRWYASALPDVVVLAANADDVMKVMRYAHQHEVPVYTRGTGVGYVGSCVPVCGGIALSVLAMNQILEIDATNGVIVTQPGAITGDIQQQVEQIGWYYPPDPASFRECSIGGNIATNAGGPRCLKYGVTKNYVLGLKVVLADGSLLELGGKCHKNKQGLDLTAVFIGSEGMLGVIVEATLRMIPLPQHRALLGVTFDTFQQAAVAVETIFNNQWLPSSLEIVDHFTLDAARTYLGKDNLPAGNAYIMLEIDGSKHAVAEDIKQISKLLDELNPVTSYTATTIEECQKIRLLRSEFSYALRHTGMTKLNNDIVVPREYLSNLIDFTEELNAEHEAIHVASFGHAGDGNIHVNLMIENYQDSSIQELAQQQLDKLFHWVLAHGGAITGEHGVGLARQPWIKEALGVNGYLYQQKLKQAFDPKNILNPGKFLDEEDIDYNFDVPTAKKDIPE